MNRFHDIPGDISTQLSPWELKRRGFPRPKAIFLLHKEIKFRSDIAGGVIAVPTGFLSDLASIPRAAWTIFMAPDDPKIELGAWVHDYLYGHVGNICVSLGNGYMMTKSLTRKQCDRVLAFECMPELGASKIHQYAVYFILRLFGGSSFNMVSPVKRWRLVHETHV